jgi:signal transduction histidine kinase
MSALVKQMLAFSRQQVMQPQPVRIAETLTGTTDMLRHLLGSRVVLRFDFAPQLPPIMADPQMLQQIILTLVANARDAMSSGGHLTVRALEVHFAAEDLAGKPDRRPGRFIQLSLTDTGSGMDSATLGHLFEPVFTTKGVGTGRGMGLASVYGMVSQHAGWIEVDSAVGQGTTFDIYFPVAQSAPAQTPSAAARPDAPVASPGS